MLREVSHIDVVVSPLRFHFAHGMKGVILVFLQHLEEYTHVFYLREPFEQAK